MSQLSKIALGGGCHWCTEAVFQSLRGVEKVEQGFIASYGEHSLFSEAVIVHFLPEKISLEELIEVHLMTHRSNVAHSMRHIYRSAIYVFHQEQKEAATLSLEKYKELDPKIITEVLVFKEFKPSRKEIQDYYLKDPQKPFCQRYIVPKLENLKEKKKNLLKEMKT